jgi:hypothetical protein
MVEQRAGAPASKALAPARGFTLAGNERVEARRDPEEVQRRCLVPEPVQRSGKVGGAVAASSVTAATASCLGGLLRAR